MRWKNILYPTDYSGPSEAALRYVVQLREESDARLIVLHAVGTLGPENLSYGEVSQPQPETYRRRLWDELHQHVQVTNVPLEAKYVLSDDDAATAILEAATQYQCDLIVMGSHGRTGWQHWLGGSVVDQVIRRAPCPVLVVKEPAAGGHVQPGPATALHPHLLVEE